MALLRSANWLWLIAINMPLPRSEEMTFARGSKAYPPYGTDFVATLRWPNATAPGDEPDMISGR
jgi:hypothetical protein